MAIVISPGIPPCPGYIIVVMMDDSPKFNMAYKL
jgi:hypothetical protein